jgi:hypothetical protein
VDRDSLGWNAQLNGRGIVYLYGRKGQVCWETGVISSYDAETGLHRVSPADGTTTLTANLLACKSTTFQEWRFVQPEEHDQVSLRAWLDDHQPELNDDNDDVNSDQVTGSESDNTDSDSN